MAVWSVRVIRRLTMKTKERGLFYKYRDPAVWQFSGAGAHFRIRADSKKWGEDPSWKGLVYVGWSRAHACAGPQAWHLAGLPNRGGRGHRGFGVVMVHHRRVGAGVAPRPSHRSVLAQLRHTALQARGSLRGGRHSVTHPLPEPGRLAPTPLSVGVACTRGWSSVSPACCPPTAPWPDAPFPSRGPRGAGSPVAVVL